MLVIHDYECENCGNQFDDMVEKDERDDVLCPKCGKPASRLISGPSGWCEDYESIKEKIDRDVKIIDKKVKKGDEKTIDNFRGEEKF